MITRAGNPRTCCVHLLCLLQQRKPTPWTSYRLSKPGHHHILLCTSTRRKTGSAEEAKSALESPIPRPFRTPDIYVYQVQKPYVVRRATLAWHPLLHGVYCCVLLYLHRVPKIDQIKGMVRHLVLHEHTTYSSNATNPIMSYIDMR